MATSTNSREDYSIRPDKKIPLTFHHLRRIYDFFMNFLFGLYDRSSRIESDESRSSNSDCLLFALCVVSVRSWYGRLQRRPDSHLLGRREDDRWTQRIVA